MYKKIIKTVLENTTVLYRTSSKANSVHNQTALPYFHKICLKILGNIT